MPRTVVIWKDEDEDDDGQAVGPVSVVTGEDLSNPEQSDEWPEWAPRSVAEEYATEHGFEFVADE